MRSWSTREAQERLDVLVESTQKDGPQRLHTEDGASAVLISTKDFERLLRAIPNLGDFLAYGPLDSEDLPARVKPRVDRDEPPD
jgi:hypothetical protein